MADAEVVLAGFDVVAEVVDFHLFEVAPGDGYGCGGEFLNRDARVIPADLLFPERREGDGNGAA